MSKGSSQKRLKKKLLPRLLEEQRWRCCYCICEVIYSSSKHKHENFATLEHVEPRHTFKIANNFQLNGKDYGHFDKAADDYANCVVACAKCNHLRGNLDAYLFAEQELWRPENSQRLKLHQLKAAFVQYGSMKTLQRMGSYHCDCQGPTPDEIDRRLNYHNDVIDIGYEKGLPLAMVNLAAVSRIASKRQCLIQTRAVEGHPVFIGVKLTKCEGLYSEH